VSFAGNWRSSTATSYYGGNRSLLSMSSRRNSYTWQTGVLSASSSCAYQVYVWWASGADRSPSAPYLVTGHTAGPATRYVDQRSGGGQWQLHGTYTFAMGARASVRLSDPYGPVSADAIRLVRATSAASASSDSAVPVLVENGGAGTSFSGKWCKSSTAGALGDGSLYSCGGSTDTYRWKPSVPAAARYEVFLWWTANANRSTAVPVVVSHAAGSATASVNQRQNGGLWNSLGTFSFPVGANGFVQVGKNGGQTSADGVLLVPRP
jgi:hypothetical protein